VNFALPVFILGLAMVPVFGFLTARDSGRIGWPRWPARYPRKSNYGDMRARARAFAVAVVKPITEEEWDRFCRGHGWQPGDEEEQVRT
jgi:hypothetical protein